MWFRLYALADLRTEIVPGDLVALQLEGTHTSDAHTTNLLLNLSDIVAEQARDCVRYHHLGKVHSIPKESSRYHDETDRASPN